MSTLLEISEDMAAFASLIDECDGELSPEAEQALTVWFAELGDARDTKIDNYCALCREVQLRAAARKEEQERLAKRVSVDTHTLERLKDRLKLFLELQGIKRLETKRYAVSVCANGGKQPIALDIAPEKLAPLYQRTEIKADMECIRMHLEMGNQILGARILPRGSHLRIM